MTVRSVRLQFKTKGERWNTMDGGVGPGVKRWGGRKTVIVLRGLGTFRGCRLNRVLSLSPKLFEGESTGV